MGAKPSISEDRLLSLTDSCLCHGSLITKFHDIYLSTWCLSVFTILL